MKVTVNGVEYSFLLNSFAPMYTYEVIMGEPFAATTTRNIHIMMFATLLAGNPDEWKMTMAQFTEWLYDHPAEEQAMASAISDEFIRRAELSFKKKE